MWRFRPCSKKLILRKIGTYFFGKFSNHNIITKKICESKNQAGLYLVTVEILYFITATPIRLTLKFRIKKN